MKKMSRFFRSLAIALLTVALLTGCVSSTSAGLVGANRGQLMLYSEEQMNEVAEQQYSEVIADAKKAGTLNKNTTTVKRVRNIANRLIAQTGSFRRDAPNWDWEVNVITEKTVNAWCMPGGKIVVYTGIIDTLKLTDGELAAVMGHEISHALREHGREQASREAMTQLGISVLAASTDMGELGQLALALGAEFGLTRPFSRSNETEADNIGTELMARAGYDPNEAVNVWKKMERLSGNDIPEFMSTHPSHSSRIDNLSEVAKKVYPLYEKAR